MKRSLGFLLCAIAFAAPLGCGGGGRGASELQLEALRAEIVKLRADTAILTERLDAVEIAQGTYKGSGSKEKASGGGSGAAGSKGLSGGGGGDDRPDLAVVKLGPENPPEEAGGDDEAGDGGRTVIRSVSGGAVVEEKASPSAKGSEGAQRDYDQALDLYKSKNYDKALEAFTGFLAHYPDHENADNAVFWRGECYLAKGETRRAVEQFQAVVSTYPKGNKAPDALLRLAQGLSTLGDSAGADAARKKLRSSYPTSDAAKKLEKSGNRAPSQGAAGGKP